MANRSTIDSSLMKLFTAPERSLLTASRGGDLEKATETELGRLVARARTLRDKWRDQFRMQRRTTVKTERARVTEGNERSREKAELFADAVGRFEARIAALGAKVSAAVTAGRKAAARAKPGKTARAAAHRGTRAQTRKALAEFVTAEPGRRAVSRAAKVKAATASADAEITAADTLSASRARGGATTKGAKTKRSKKRLVGRAPTAIEAVATKHKRTKKAVGLDPLAQLKAQSKLKATRFKISGRDTQTRGHMAAQTRRAQGRRDSRGR
jgi:hypothetical protein